MENKIEYEQIDLSNVGHIECLSEIWNDRYTKEFYDIGRKTLMEFLSTFSGEETKQYERLIKRGSVYIGWIRAFRAQEDLTLDCIILKKFRGLGFGKEVLKDLIDKNRDVNIKIEVRKDNHRAIKSLKSFEFSTEVKTAEGMLIYRLSRKS